MVILGSPPHRTHFRICKLPFKILLEYGVVHGMINKIQQRYTKFTPVYQWSEQFLQPLQKQFRARIIIPRGIDLVSMPRVATVIQRKNMTS